jgi:hypothetical protein
MAVEPRKQCARNASGQDISEIKEIIVCCGPDKRKVGRLLPDALFAM